MLWFHYKLQIANYKLSNEGFSIITNPKNSLNVAICCYMLWFHYQEWSQETSKDRTTCQKCWAMHDDEFEDVDDQSDEDNGSDQIFSQVRTTCTIVLFWVSTCRNIHWCHTNLVTLIFIAINPRPFHPTLTSTLNSHCDSQPRIPCPYHYYPDHRYHHLSLPSSSFKW